MDNTSAVARDEAKANGNLGGVGGGRKRTMEGEGFVLSSVLEDLHQGDRERRMLQKELQIE